MVLYHLRRLVWMLFVLLPASLIAQSVSQPQSASKGVPSVVRDMGYCADVGSAQCPVRAYWPRQAGRPDGVDAYYFVNSDRQVCFTTRANYLIAYVGSTKGTDACIWRNRQWGPSEISEAPANWRAE